MRPRAGAPTVSGVTFTRLTLDLERGADPIAGELGLRGEVPRRFSGYVQLVEALEQLREVAGHLAEPPSKQEERDSK